MGEANNNTRTYFKVFATFKCSSDACNRSWNSAHAWKRDESITCEWCHEMAELMHIVDETLTLDNYRCTTATCDGNYWQSIHDGMNSPQECDICGVLVDPDSVQERFGRHYYFTCQNDFCPLKPEWEDFSLEPQKTQRCTACFSRGDIIKIQELRPRPGWVRRRRQERLAAEGLTDNINLGGGRGGGGGDVISSHNADFCDMCADIKRQGLGKSCFKAKKIVTEMERADDGNETERIINAE